MSVIVVRGSEIDTRSLLALVSSFPSLCSKTVTPDDAISSFSLDGSVMHLNITTKYYTAPVALHRTPIDAPFDGELALEGCIFVASADEPELNEVLHHKSDLFYEKSEMRLLVLFKNAMDEYESTRITNVGWAMDNGFEFIEIDKENIVEGYNEREKDGLPRLMEALESNMWSTMVRRQPEVIATNAPSALIPEQNRGKSISSSDVVQPLSSHKEGTVIENGVNPVELANSMADSTTVLESKSTSVAAVSVLQEQEDSHSTVDVFANIIAQAKEFRNKATDGSLTDQQRRTNAAAIAMQMAKFLEMEESGEDDDENE